MRKVSVFILSYGQFHYTQLCLEYLLNGLNNYPIDEFLIIDTPTQEPWRHDVTPFKLREIKDRGFLSWPKEFFRVVTLDQNYGCTISINKGIRACKPENDVMFVSNDILMGPNWLAPLVKCAYDERWQNKIGFVAPYISPEICLDEKINAEFRTRYLNNHLQLMAQTNPEEIRRQINLLYGGNFLDFAREFVARNQGKIYDLMHSCTMYMKRDTLNTIGLLDEQFSYLFNGQLGGYGSDDIDMFIRQHNAGLFQLTCFDSFCHHIMCATNRKREHPDNKDIQSGNKLLNKWKIDYDSPTIEFPFETAGKKTPFKRWKKREIPLQGNKYQINWGGVISKEEGYQMMINKLGGMDRTDAFPL